MSLRANTVGRDGRSRLVPIALSQIIGLVCGIAGVKLITHLVPPSPYGLYGIFISLAPVGMWFIHAGVIKFLGRHWLQSSARGTLLRTCVGAMSRQLPWLAGLTAAIALTVASGGWLPTWLLLLFAAVCLAWSGLAQSALQAGRDHWRDFAVSATGSITRSFIPPLLYAFASGTVLILFTGFAIHAAVMAAVAAWALRRYFRATGPADAINAVYAGPLFVVVALLSWVLAGLQRWLVTSFYGAAEGGYFMLASNLATLVPAILGTIALQYFQPEFFSCGDGTAAHRSMARKVDQVALAHAILSVAGLLALRLIAPWLVGPLIQESYRQALDLLLPAGAATLGLVTGWFYHSMLLAAKREQAAGRTDIIVALVIIAGSVIAACSGRNWLYGWMCISPLIPWTIGRMIARRALFTPTAGAAPARAR